MDVVEYEQVKEKIKAGVTLFMEAKQMQATIGPRLTELGQESHSMEGQMQQILAQAGVSSVAELAETLRQQADIFLKYATDINGLMKQVNSVLEEVDKKRLEASSGQAAV